MFGCNGTKVRAMLVWFHEGKGYQNRSGNLSGNLCGNLCGILLQAITWVLSVFVCLLFVSLSCSMHEDTLVYIYIYIYVYVYIHIYIYIYT